MPSYKFNKDNRDNLKIMPQKKSNEYQQEQISSSLSKASWQVDNDSKDPFEFLADEKGSIDHKEEDDPSYLNQSEKTDKEYTTDDYEDVLEEYPLNDDSSPKLIRKKPRQHLEYVQEIYLRYLRPPSPEPPGEIIIKEKDRVPTPPPLIIRQQPPRPPTPEPIIIREIPPIPPPPLPRKIITISSKCPPPARKVIFERLPAIPQKPQPIIIERWLPYKTPKRRVIYETVSSNTGYVKPKNVIIQWEPPQMSVRKQISYLGVIQVDPIEYLRRYGPEVKARNELPAIVNEIKTPEGLKLAKDVKENELQELEGDLHALTMIDLESNGLGEYKDYLASRKKNNQLQI